jgi:hypothetical protein
MARDQLQVSKQVIKPQPNSSYNTLFSRFRFLKGLRALPLAASISVSDRSYSKMAPLTNGKVPKSTKMHSKVVRLIHLPFTITPDAHSCTGHHRVRSCGPHCFSLSRPREPQSRPLRGLHGKRFRCRRPAYHDHRWCVHTLSPPVCPHGISCFSPQSRITLVSQLVFLALSSWTNSASSPFALARRSSRRPCPRSISLHARSGTGERVRNTMNQRPPTRSSSRLARVRRGSD